MDENLEELLPIYCLFVFYLDNGTKEYPALTLKEVTADYYNVCSSSVCDHTDRIKQNGDKPTQKFEEDAY